jgi:hypothetical protein
VAQPDDRGDLVIAVREDDHVGERRVREPFAVTMLVAYRAGRDGAAAEVGGEPRHEVSHRARVRPRTA